MTPRTLALALVIGALCRPVVAVGQQPQHDMMRMADSAARPTLLEVPITHAGSGTAWLPAASPRRMVHVDAGEWTVMLHGEAFGLNNQQQTLHGGAQWAMLDWEMASASRSAAGGLLRFNAMTSLESFTLPDSGYHELLQTGETFRGRRRADVEHADQPLMELSGAYDHTITSKLATTVYAAAVGEPALGPVAYIHRPSADGDPFAPIGQHWQDAAHASVGVVTAGAFTRAVQVEGSVFNAREPNDGRLGTDLQNARLDSYAGRLTVLPADQVAVSAWAGYLADHDPLTPGLGMQRYGASILGEIPLANGQSLSAAAIWGMNVHHHSDRLHVHDATAPQRLSHPSSSVLFEATWRWSERTSLYGRAEQVQKMADDFGFLGGDLAQLFTVRALSVGVTHDVLTARGLSVGIGARGALNLMPATLEPTYQTRHAAGFVMYLTLQPAGSRRGQRSGTSTNEMDSFR
ncbi:MAG TPA: hypothetical protein VN706_10855 [Gemmatimonadaceae bacterium]|nr:hypothetical protein [Gemmatimonadaceae bacterium]